jgi:hypothetical protein
MKQKPEREQACKQEQKFEREPEREPDQTPERKPEQGQEREQECAQQQERSGEQEQTREREDKPEWERFESRLRYSIIAAFGALFLLSYAVILVLLFDLVNPFDQGRVNAGLDTIALQATAVLPVAVLGILMLLSVFKRKVFHGFAGLVLIYKLYSIIAYLLPYGVLRNGDFFGDSNMIAWWIGDVLSFSPFTASLTPKIVDLIFWCIPFALYYLLLGMRKRRG